jgi:hypothetical protein
VLNTEGMKNPGGTVVHPYRQDNLQLMHGPAKKFTRGIIQTQFFRSVIQLLLSNSKGIEFVCHFQLLY